MRSAPIKRKRRIKPLSEKRKTALAEYTAKRIVFLAENPYCGIGVDGCEKRASEVHHLRGRVGADLLDESMWKGACRPCHQYVTEHPKEAIERGWALPRIGRAS
jgi:hypothetical protein